MSLYPWTTSSELQHDLVYGDVKVSKSGLKTVDLKIQKEITVKFVLQTPRMRMPFGISAYGGDLKSSKLQLEFVEGSPFHTFCMGIDEANLKHAVKIQSALLETRNKKAELIAEKQFKLVSESKGAYPPSLKVKVPYTNELVCSTIIVDEDHKRATVDDVPRRGEAIAIIEITGLWATASGWGATTRLAQLKFFPESDEEEEPALMFTE
ncbi:MAG: hypothetical protein CL859_07335 [Cyanobium sp. ARS6]|nr:hypothetical protein [Cyanobium sp. ARS6]